MFSFAGAGARIMIRTAQWIKSCRDSVQKKGHFFSQNPLTNETFGVIIKVQKRDMKEVNKMTHIDFDTYQLICDLMDNDDLDLADIAVMAGVTLADVQYVYRAENDVM